MKYNHVRNLKDIMIKLYKLIKLYLKYMRKYYLYRTPAAIAGGGRTLRLDLKFVNSCRGRVL